MAKLLFLQVVLLPVFPVSLEEEPTVLDRLLSVTCADLVVCSPQQRSGESGTKRSTLDRSEHFQMLHTPLMLTYTGDSLPSLPWLPLPSQLF